MERYQALEQGGAQHIALLPEEENVLPAEENVVTPIHNRSFHGFPVSSQEPTEAYNILVGSHVREEDGGVSIPTTYFYGGGGVRSIVRASGPVSAGTTPGTSWSMRPVPSFDASDDNYEDDDHEHEIDGDERVEDERVDVKRGSAYNLRKKLVGEHTQPRAQTVAGKDAGTDLVARKVFYELGALVTCPECSESDLEMNVTNVQLDTVIELKCLVCDHIVYKHAPKKLAAVQRVYSGCCSQLYPITAGVVASAMTTGIGFAGVSKIIELTNMNGRIGSSQYMRNQSEIGEQMKTMCIDQRNTVNTCVREHYADIGRPADPDTRVQDVDVSYDGTWQTRGFQSKIGCGFVIEAETGFILDYEVASKFCLLCKRIEHKHKHDPELLEEAIQHHKENGDCSATHDGTSGAMEARCAENMWRRSVDLNDMRYTAFISDGDSSAYNAVKDLDIYDGKEIVKEECINHVQKRLSSRLRKLKKESYTSVPGKMKRVSTMVGKGKLTDDVIDRLASYFGIALRSCIGKPIVFMKKRIMAGFLHVTSTDENPQHQFCPQGDNTYCFYNKATGKGEVPQSHKEMRVKCDLSVGDTAKVLKVYEDLTRDELLLKCVSGRTQNPNESLHAKLWAKAPKHKFFGKNRIDALAALVVSEHNMGYDNCDLMNHLDPKEKTPSSYMQARNRESQRKQIAERKKLSKKRCHRPVSPDMDYEPGAH